MLEKIKNMLGIKTVDYNALIESGAEIIDVRSKGEYAGGHIKGSKNIPLDRLQEEIKKLNREKIIITCCASGVRSGIAKTLLEGNGFSKVYNGGGWSSLKSKISKQ